MSSTLDFDVRPTTNPAGAEQRAALLVDPGFGRVFTDHMVTIKYAEGKGWYDARLEPYGPISLDPATAALHYGQEIFEGLKVYRHPDGELGLFRPEQNARRFNRSAARLAMPQLPEELFLESIRILVEHDKEWVPSAPETSLYLRPFMFATDPYLGVRPAQEYLYVLIASPVGAYFPRGVEPVSVWLSTDYTRAAPGGTGEAKCAGNYAASLVAQAQAAAQGCDQVVWLDAIEHKYIEEMGGMNLYFILDGDTLVTPELNGSLLPGVTRDSILLLAEEFGLRTEVRRISTDEWRESAASGRMTEAFACGTAAVITPVGHVKSSDGEFTVADGGSGEVTMKLRGKLLDIQHGRTDDTHGWVTRL
ncbi:branched-chain amino acid aminotransferase [Cryptosporangium aurantiacum]|uniref:Branched-chain-amino-acid aminotransferase n=1 Tax=Cryptosporangium aurantiacum TaxID=134849 RepID=A0A1M7HLV1_9ACTN|nr:branched-chain amino acid aminotransferase [Cryptosporangium aurantiacum]SHM29486.1 branched chain amino acid aminotransferase apoenzyme [Cryptosporangium aurantiacum]